MGLRVATFLDDRTWLGRHRSAGRSFGCSVAAPPPHTSLPSCLNHSSDYSSSSSSGEEEERRKKQEERKRRKYSKYPHRSCKVPAARGSSWPGGWNKTRYRFSLCFCCS
mmetsp:Transcript_15501/g.33931  ORF Transcript_15501/g.33931 Transcript_15501/m.33931 type:complete len:109 (+) Transcript_15501:180-506(+)